MLGDDSIVWAVDGTEGAILLHGLGVLRQGLLFLGGVGVPDTGVVNQQTLVHAAHQVTHHFRVAVGVDAASGELDTAKLVVFHDPLREIDSGATTERMAQPVELHIGDLVRQLADEDTCHSFFGQWGRLDVELLGWVWHERDLALQCDVQGVLREGEVLLLIDDGVGAVGVVAVDARHAREQSSVAHFSSSFQYDKAIERESKNK